MIDSSIGTARGQSRNWMELPDDFTAAVFSRLGAIETIESAQMVCMKWRRISKEPLTWLKIDMHNDGDIDEMEYLEKMCRHAIDRSCGNVVDINIEYFGTDELLMFITNSASGTRRLRLFSCDKISDFGLGRLAWKLPFLEELDISLCVQIAHVSLEVVGRYCPLLKSLKLKKDWCTFPSTLNKRRRKFSSKLNNRRPNKKLNNVLDESKSDLEEDEDYEDDWIHEKTPDPPKQHDNADAFAIARTMHGLHHLQLWGNKLTNDGLRKILDFCHHLESLDLRRCCNLNMEEDLGRRYAEQIKNLLHPHESIEEKDFTSRSEGCCPIWIELPDDIITSILSRFTAIDILKTIQMVCTKWRKICKDPLMWHTIDLHTNRSNLAYDLDKICRNVIDRSCGNLVDVNVGNYITNGLLKYMTDSSSGIRRLQLVGSDVVSDMGVIEMASKLPLLEDLEIALCQSVTHRSLNVLGNSCPMLKSLKFNKLWIDNPFSDHSDDSDEPSDDRLGTLGKGFDNGDALAVAGTMPGLHHLQLFGNEMSNDGLMEILDGCPHLESLDLRHCYNLNLEENLKRRCGKQIKKLLLPNDSLVGYAHPTDVFGLYHSPKYISYGKYINEDYSRYNDHLTILFEQDFGDCDPTDDYMDLDCCSCFDSD